MDDVLADGRKLIMSSRTTLERDIDFLDFIDVSVRLPIEDVSG